VANTRSLPDLRLLLSNDVRAVSTKSPEMQHKHSGGVTSKRYRLKRENVAFISIGRSRSMF